MIQAGDFVEAARAHGFLCYAGVPCSFLTPFINYVINDDGLIYISSANEGDAVATAAGAAIGGMRTAVMMQNSGLGNAVSPLTSLAHVFRIPLLLIATHRGAPGVSDEPQHELMGAITERIFETMRIPCRAFPVHVSEIETALEQALAWLKTESRPYAFLMQKDAVAPFPLRNDAIPSRGVRGTRRAQFPGAARPARSDVLQRIISLTPESDSIVVATTGYTGRELFAIQDRPNQLYMVGSMGCASSLGLGLSLAQPDRRIVVIDGDGAALMRMGNLATLGTYGANLVHIVLDNEVHESTGGQATVAANVDFASIAAACGYGAAFSGESLELIDALFEESAQGRRTCFGHLKIRRGTLDPLPRPGIGPAQVVRRLMRHIGTEF